jgi:hypothetical protein
MFDLMAKATVVFVVAPLGVSLIFMLSAMSILVGFMSGDTNALGQVANQLKDGFSHLASLTPAFLTSVAHSTVYLISAIIVTSPLTWLALGRQNGRANLQIPQLSRQSWIEYYSPLDPVSVGTAANRLATTVRVYNLEGLKIWREHTAYFRNDREVLPDLTRRLGRIVNLDLPGPEFAHASSRLRRLSVTLVEYLPTIAGAIVGLFAK